MCGHCGVVAEWLRCRSVVHFLVIYLVWPHQTFSEVELLMR